jgi:hypothetical protein
MIVDGDLAAWHSAGVNDEPQAAQDPSDITVTATPFFLKT